MLETTGKILKIIFFCLYGLVLIPSVALAAWLWPKREKIENEFWRALYTALIFPVVAVAYTVGTFEDWHGDIAKF